MSTTATPAAAAVLDIAMVRSATSEGRVLVAHCRSCGHQQAMPAGSCFGCGADALEVRSHAGTGSLYSWTQTGIAFEPELAADVPYTVGVVALDGGARVWARIEGVAPRGVEPRAGLPLALDVAATGERRFLVFRPSPAE